MKYICWLNI